MSGQPIADQNPYAAPRADPAPDFEPALGVGAWRHGTLLVIHEDAHLPTVCLKTGRPATSYRTSDIRWSHPLRWPREYLQVAVPLTQRPAFLYGAGRWIVLATTIVSAMLCISAIVISNVLEQPQLLVFAYVGGIGALVLFSWWLSLSQLLWLVKRRRKYYWLSGASKKFLAHLPPWPLS